jgi:hypothetical protein
MPSRSRDPQDYPQTFHTRATLQRLPVFHQARADCDQEQAYRLPESELFFIPGRGQLKRRRMPTGVQLISKLAILPLVVLLLVGVGAFGASLALDCAEQQARQGCFASRLFPVFAGDQAYIAPPTPAAPAQPALPAIPNDLPNNVHSFAALALPYAIQAHQALGWPTSVILAQWGLEHGWSVPDANGYNWGNTTFAPNCQYRGSRFCYAPTPAEGLREYVYTARLHYYDGIAPAARQGGADATAVALGESPWDAGHYTTNGQPGSSLIAIMRDFNLYRLDTGS